MPEIIIKIFVAFVGIGIATVLFLIASHILWLPWLLERLADHNFFITSVPEGRAKAIMKYGGFDRLVLSWKNHYLNHKWDVIKFEDDIENYREDIHPKSNHWIDKFLPGGLRWVGWPFANTVYCYHFQWSSIRQGTLDNAVQNVRGTESTVYQDNLKDLLVSRDETPDYILLKKDVYGQTFQDTEDQEMIPLAFITLLTAEVHNPYKALFHTEQWLEQILNFLRSYIKDYVGQRSFAELTGTVAKREDGKSELDLSRKQSDEILKDYKATDKNNTPLGEYILEQWGVSIDHINLVNFKTAGQRGKAYEEAASIQYVQGQKAKGIMKIADAEAYRIEKVAAAMTAGEDNALILRTLEAYETMGENGANMIIGGGDKPVQMLIDSARRNPKPVNKQTDHGE